MKKGFNKTEFMAYLEESFAGFDSAFLRATVDNLVDYGLEHQHASLDQFCYWLSDMLPEVEFKDVAAYMDDNHLTAFGKKQKNIALFNATEPDLYFTVRDMFGDDVGEKGYPDFESALDTLKSYCDDSEPAHVDGAMLGIVCRDGDMIHRCVLVQNNVNKYDENVLTPQHDNINAEALAVPQIELAALKAKQLRYPFDEVTQNRIDVLEKQLGIFERDTKTVGDLYTGKWRVHIVPTGGRYGVNNNLVNKDDHSIVEFWDMSANKANFPHGQFVMNYSIETLFEDTWGPSPEDLMEHGLCLYGDVPGWSVGPYDMVNVFEWFKKRELEPGEQYIECHGDVQLPFAADQFGNSIRSRLEKLVFVKDIKDVQVKASPERGAYCTFTITSQANRSTMEKGLQGPLSAVGYIKKLEFNVKAKEVKKAPLDNVIDGCAAQVKDGAGIADRFVDKEK